MSQIYDIQTQLVSSWTAPGPVAAAFLADRRKVKFICGPVGSGKTTTADVVNPLIKATLQRPGRDGVRHYRLITFRDTQRNAWKSSVPSVLKWLPQSLGKFTGSEDRPCQFKFQARHPADGGLIKIELWWYGIPQDLETLEQALKGVEATDINLAEADGLPRWMYEWSLGRIGRYPAATLGECVNPQIFGTFNAVDFDHWLYDVCVENNDPEFLGFHHQPPAVLGDSWPYTINPAAENVQGYGTFEKFQSYYLDQARGARKPYVKRALKAEFGAVEGEGFLVYPEFTSEHVKPIPDGKGDLLLGMDAGGTPCAVLGQWADTGEIDLIDECVIYDPKDEKRMTLATGLGPGRFVDALRQMLTPYQGRTIRIGWIDPSAFYGNDPDHGDLAFAVKVARELDIRVEPAPCPGNDRVLREEGLRQRLSLRGEGGRVMLRISPRCRWLLMGLRGKYQYQESTKDGRKVADDKRRVVKNAWSHVCEAAEYLVLGMLGGRRVLNLPVGQPKSRLPGATAQGNRNQYRRGGVRW